MKNKGIIYIVGIGPGGLKHLTVKAKEVLENCDIVVGYRTYVDLILPLIKGKEVFSTGMTQEVERCQKAIEFAMDGKNVAVVSSGDSGIYGMTGLVLELLEGQGSRGKGQKDSVRGYERLAHAVEVIPGVPAFCAASALLGAPLMHDFASISLSDLLTPWDVIKKRLDAAAKGDFVIVLYNPKSKKRITQIDEAIGIISRYRNAKTPVGIVKNATRENEELKTTTLKDVSKCYDFIDMTTIIIIGNSQTFLSEGKMITPRGYERKLKV